LKTNKDNHDNHDNQDNQDNKISPFFNHILLVIGLAGAAKTTVVLVIFAAN
jgi:hypothetical protein